MKIESKASKARSEKKSKIIRDFQSLPGNTTAKVEHLSEKYHVSLKSVYNYIRGMSPVSQAEILCECGWEGQRKEAKHVYKVFKGENVPVDRCPQCYKEV